MSRSLNLLASDLHFALSQLLYWTIGQTKLVYLGGGYHRVQALCQLVVQLDVVDLEVELALVSTVPHLEPEPLLKLSPESALVRRLHPLGAVVHPQGPVVNVSLGRGALTDGQQATVHHEVMLNGLD